MLRRLDRKLFQEVDAASLAVFRLAFGGILLWEVWRYFSHGWIARYYIQPTFHFKYYGFSWVEPWIGSGMYWHFIALGLLAGLIAVGALYRLATVLFFFGFTYVFLLDQARYLNHFYFVILFAFLLCVLPANRAFSVDARFRPNAAPPTVPAWTVWVIRFQLEVLYIYGGLVKLNPDWLRLEPLRTWLGARSDFPFIGSLFLHDPAVIVGAYGVILLHLVGAPLLLWRRARPWVFMVYCGFHTMNHFLFQIGIFPWLTLAATTIFFEPDWPRRLVTRLRRQIVRFAAPAASAR